MNLLAKMMMITAGMEEASVERERAYGIALAEFQNKNRINYQVGPDSLSGFPLLQLF